MHAHEHWIHSMPGGWIDDLPMQASWLLSWPDQVHLASRGCEYMWSSRYGLYLCLDLQYWPHHCPPGMTCTYTRPTNLKT